MCQKQSLYCVVKEGTHYIGSRSEILYQIGKFGIEGKNRELVMQLNGSKIAIKYHSYGEIDPKNKDQYNEEEAFVDSVNFLFNKLEDYGFMVFKSI